jgi:hypothetical protein
MIPTNSSVIIERVPANATNYQTNFKSKGDDEPLLVPSEKYALFY